MVSSGWTHTDISGVLRTITGIDRGFSARSIGRFCTRRCIHRHCGVCSQELDRLVSELVNRVGHVYGRRTVQGLLRSCGVYVGQRRVSASLQRVAPLEYASRRFTTHRLLNRVPYRADHFGQKLHLDQNEKVAMYGVTHALAVDGYS